MKEVYLLKSSYTGYYKIGVSKNTAKRIKQLQTGTAEDIDIISVYKTDIPFKLETALHNFYSMYKVNREWYNLPLEVELEYLEFCKKTETNLLLVAKKD